MAETPVIPMKPDISVMPVIPVIPPVTPVAEERPVEVLRPGDVLSSPVVVTLPAVEAGPADGAPLDAPGPVVVPPLVMHYQPIVSLTTGAVVGCEALLRFVGVDGTPRPPVPEIDRIEATEESANELTAAVIREVDRDLVPILKAHPHFYVSINIPPIVLGNGMAGSLISRLRLFDYLDQVMVEVTERQALTDRGREALRLSREAGLRIAVDDFGTGESGLAQLLCLDFDVLKIDRGQITPLMKNLSAERLLRGVVALAAALRVTLVAEGVETPEQALFLRAAGVDYGQGWYWSKAVPGEELRTLITRGFSVPAAAF